MSQPDYDSALQLAIGLWAERGGVAPAAELPVLDLSSEGPLPVDLPEQPAAPRVAPAAAASVERIRSADGSMWLDGDVLMCACPECGAPMSIRLWLMVADCWRCATSIELSEEQEREARRLLRERDRRREAAGASAVAPAAAAAPVAAAVASASVPVARPSPPPAATARAAAAPATAPVPPPTPARRQPPREKEPRRRVAAAQKPIGVRAKIRKMAVLGGTRVLLHDLLKQMPAWLISLLLHLVALTLLALLTIRERQAEPLITLSSRIAPTRIEGDVRDAVLMPHEERFDLPFDEPQNERQRQALILANQDARQLRIDPNTPDPHLPPLSQLKELVGSDNLQQRMLATRDPRVRVQVVEQEGGTTMTEAAVARGLRWISRQQNADGGWGLRGRGRSDMAGTSLALLPFLGAGQTHLTGLYRDEVAQGLRWMIEHQRPNGDLRYGTSGNEGMYAHGQAAIVLCEAFAMTGDEQLRIPAQKSIDFIVEAQHAEGGWRYEPRQPGDLSVVGWQLMALQSARAAHLTVPEETLELADRFLDRVAHDGGAKYGYQPGREATETMTAEGLLSRIYLGWNKQDHPQLMRGARWLVDQHLPNDRNRNIYYWYYGTQALHHVGGPEWERWNAAMREVLVSTQETAGEHAGSWSPSGDRWGNQGGRLFQTSLSVCTLEVYYRHAPIFRRIQLE